MPHTQRECLFFSFPPSHPLTAVQPKAGQGMNTAFLDAQNLAWKIHLVEKGFAQRSLLQTYEYERKDVAENLLAFDNKYAKLFSAKPPTADQVQAAGDANAAGSNAPADKKDDFENNPFVLTFKESCEFTSGYGVAYQPSVITWSPQHPVQTSIVSPAGCKLRPGRLFVNADVTRVVDANVVHLEQEVPLNGSFRIFIFAGEPDKTAQALRDLESGLRRKGSVFAAFRRADEDAVSYHEKHNPHSLFFTFCIIFARQRSGVEISRDVPGLLARYRDHVYADDRGAEAAAHAKMGFDPRKGGVVVVRPDGYTGFVVGLEEGSSTVDALDQYFASFCTAKRGPAAQL